MKKLLSVATDLGIEGKRIKTLRVGLTIHAY
jgi:hypothetical protein